MRGEVRLGFHLYRSWGGGGGGEYGRIKKLGEKALQITHSRTAVSVPVSQVPVLKVYCLFFLGWYRYQ